MVDENGLTVDVAGPAKPVQVLGWNGVPNVGDEFREVEDEREARHVAAERESRVRSAEVVNQRPASLQELLRRQERQDIPELNLVVKADVQGSLGALTDAFLKLPQDEVRVNLVHSGAGAITEHDVDLAKTASAIVVGFNVRPNANARELAENEGVDIRLYRVIYDAIDDVKAALSGHAEAGGARVDPRRGGGPSDVPGPEARRDRRVLPHPRARSAGTRRCG